jgi:hypothetical protein
MIRPTQAGDSETDKRSEIPFIQHGSEVAMLDEKREIVGFRFPRFSLGKP